MTRALILATCAALLTGTEALGQEAELRRRHAEKLQQPFLQRNGWETDYDQALARAQAAGSAKAVVFAYFTRSYGACPPCDALERGPFSSPEFARFAESVVPYCHVTTRIPGHPRDDLLPKVCGPKAGTPSIAYLDAQGRVIAIHRGELGVEAFQRFSEQTRRYLRLAAIPDPSLEDRVWLLRAELELNRLTDAQLTRRRADLGELEPELARTIDGAITDWRVLSLWIERQPRTDEARVRLGAEYWKLFAAGGRPQAQRALEAFYVLIFDYAESAGQPDRFAAALDALAEQVEGVAGMEGYIQQQRDRLGRLR